MLVFLLDMDESMNSVHSVSAMDISPASSPRMPLHPISSNHYVLNAFQQQQESLSNILLNSSNLHDYPLNNKTNIQDDYDMNSKSICLYSTVLTDNNDINKSPPIIPEETNQLRQRIVTESVPTNVESISTIKRTSKSFNKLFLCIPIILCIVYFTMQHMNTSIILPRSSNWQNASEYLTENLIGQDQGLHEFKDAMEKHKNFSIVLIEVMIYFHRNKLNNIIIQFIILGFNWYWKNLFSIIIRKIHTNNFNIS